MKFPVVNINGTSREQLLEGYMKARRSLNTAITDLQEIMPHGRDYQYEGGQVDFRIAHEEHVRRLLALRQVQIELDQLAEHVI